MTLTSTQPSPQSLLQESLTHLQQSISLPTQHSQRLLSPSSPSYTQHPFPLLPSLHTLRHLCRITNTLRNHTVSHIPDKDDYSSYVKKGHELCQSLRTRHPHSQVVGRAIAGFYSAVRNTVASTACHLHHEHPRYIPISVLSHIPNRLYPAMAWIIFRGFIVPPSSDTCFISHRYIYSIPDVSPDLSSPSSELSGDPSQQNRSTVHFNASSLRSVVPSLLYQWIAHFCYTWRTALTKQSTPISSSFSIMEQFLRGVPKSSSSSSSSESNHLNTTDMVWYHHHHYPPSIQAPFPSLFDTSIVALPPPRPAHRTQVSRPAFHHITLSIGRQASASILSAGVGDVHQDGIYRAVEKAFLQGTQFLRMELRRLDPQPTYLGPPTEVVEMQMTGLWRGCVGVIGTQVVRAVSLLDVIGAEEGVYLAALLEKLVGWIQRAVKDTAHNADDSTAPPHELQLERRRKHGVDQELEGCAGIRQVRDIVTMLRSSLQQIQTLVQEDNIDLPTNIIRRLVTAIFDESALRVHVLSLL